MQNFSRIEIKLSDLDLGRHNYKFVKSCFFNIKIGSFTLHRPYIDNVGTEELAFGY